MPKDKSNPIIDLISELVRDLKEALTSHHTKELRHLHSDIKLLREETKHNHKELKMIIDELAASVAALQTTTQNGLADLSAAVDEAVAEITSQLPGDSTLAALKGTVDAIASSIQSSLTTSAQRLRDAIAAAPEVPVP